jgi:hypothetical protein
MRGTRRDLRFALLNPLDSSLRIPGDVIVERYADDEIWVVSARPARVDEELTLDLTGSGPSQTIRVRVVDSVPMLYDGMMRHGLRLAVLPRG